MKDRLVIVQRRVEGQVKRGGQQEATLQVCPLPFPPSGALRLREADNMRFSFFPSLSGPLSHSSSFLFHYFNNRRVTVQRLLPDVLERKKSREIPFHSLLLLAPPTPALDCCGFSAFFPPPSSNAAAASVIYFQPWRSISYLLSRRFILATFFHFPNSSATTFSCGVRSRL